MTPEPQNINSIQEDQPARQGEGQAEKETAGPNGATTQAESTWIASIIDDILPKLTSASTNETMNCNEADEGELSVPTLINSSGED
mgnify:CR=1 FL=1